MGIGDKIKQIFPCGVRRFPHGLIGFLSRWGVVGHELVCQMNEKMPYRESAPLPVTQQLQEVSEPEKNATLDGIIDDSINLLTADKNIRVWLDDGTFYVGGAEDHKYIFSLKEGDKFGRSDLHCYAFRVATDLLYIDRMLDVEQDGKFCRSEYDEVIDARKLVQLKQLCEKKEAKYHDVEQARLAFERQKELNNASQMINFYLGK